MGPRARHANYNQGFTLIEMIVVMLLIVTLAGIAVPRMRNFVEGRRLREEGRRFLALTRGARGEAVSRGERIELRITPKEGRYELVRSPYFQHPAEETPVFQLEEGIQWKVDKNWLAKDGTASIIYHPDGALDEDGAGQVSLVDSHENALTFAPDGLGIYFEQRAATQ